MERIDCGITDCLHTFELSRTGMLDDPLDLRSRLEEEGWINLIVGNEAMEIWICPECQQLLRQVLSKRE